MPNEIETRDAGTERDVDIRAHNLGGGVGLLLACILLGVLAGELLFVLLRRINRR